MLIYCGSQKIHNMKFRKFCYLYLLLELNIFCNLISLISVYFALKQAYLF